jgi:hypothetical protein
MTNQKPPLKHTIAQLVAMWQQQARNRALLEKANHVENSRLDVLDQKMLALPHSASCSICRGQQLYIDIDMVWRICPALCHKEVRKFQKLDCENSVCYCKLWQSQQKSLQSSQVPVGFVLESKDNISNIIKNWENSQKVHLWVQGNGQNASRVACHVLLYLLLHPKPNQTVASSGVYLDMPVFFLQLKSFFESQNQESGFLNVSVASGSGMDTPGLLQALGGGSHSALWHKYQQTFLVLDQWESITSTWEKNQLDNLIRYRMQHNKKTIFIVGKQHIPQHMSGASFSPYEAGLLLDMPIQAQGNQNWKDLCFVVDL